MDQLDLLIPEPESPQREAPLAKLERYVTQGQPVTINASMLVCDVSILWDTLTDRGDQVQQKLDRFADRCEKLRAAPACSRLENQRLRIMAQEHRALGEYARNIAYGLFEDAVQKFSEEMVSLLDDDLHDAFWQDVMERPGIEVTWKLTLAQVLNFLDGHQSPCDVRPCHRVALIDLPTPIVQLVQSV